VTSFFKAFRPNVSSFTKVFIWYYYLNMHLIQHLDNCHGKSYNALCFYENKLTNLALTGWGPWGHYTLRLDRSCRYQAKESGLVAWWEYQPVGFCLKETEPSNNCCLLDRRGIEVKDWVRSEKNEVHEEVIAPIPLQL